MPQLPSGRYISVCNEKLDQLIDQAKEGVGVHRAMAIIDDATLARFLEVIELIPDEAGEDMALHPASESTSLRFKSRSTGVYTNDLAGLAKDWSQEDMDAIHAFLASPRAVKFRADLLAEVARFQDWLLHKSKGVVRMQALWWQAGCHPSQDEGWTEDEFWEGVEV